MRYLFTAMVIIVALSGSRAQTSNNIFNQDDWQFDSPAIPNELKNKAADFIPAANPEADFSFPVTTSEQTASQEEAGIRGYTSVNIGHTYFDLQTNASICKNFYKDDFTGKLYAVWNFVPQIDPYLTQRGTGYNYFTNGSWQPEPTLRLETSKNGWPNILLTHQSESEYILTHNLEFGGLQKTQRTPPITGTWTEQLNPFPPPNLYGVWWPRIIRGDSPDTVVNYIHAIALTLPTLQGGENYQGIDGALLYYRSKDNGATWDKTNELISAIDLTQYARIRPDNYAIDALQNNVAIVVGGYGNDIALLASFDNGLSWQKTVVQKFPIPLFYDQITDVTNDGIADWIDTNDGSLAVLIDNSGFIHVWAGYNQIYNNDSTDNNFTFNSTANGILYWNTTMGTEPMKMITGAIDIDGTDSLEVSKFGFFNTGWASHPSAGIDGVNRLFLTYSALAENGKDEDGKTVRHTYIIGSDNGGATWLYPYDIVNEQNAEGIYGSVARSNDANVRLIYQKDFCAGISTTAGFPDPCNSGELNHIVYVEAPANEVITSDGTSIVQSNAAITAYPNPASDIIHFDLPLTHAETGTIEITDLSGRIVLRQVRQLTSKEQVTIADLAEGIYISRIWSTRLNASLKIEVLH